MKVLFTLFSLFFYILSQATIIKGKITSVTGEELPYASISIRGTTTGTSANSKGEYTLDLNPGKYILVAQYVGYASQEKTVTVTTETMIADFILNLQELSLPEIIVSRGEDPAYEIIREAIKKRPFYLKQVDSFSVEVYIKGLIRSEGLPKRFMGQKVEVDETDGLDSSGKGILYLSESVTAINYIHPDKTKMHVISSRQSGGDQGLTFPFFINFYNNNVTLLSSQLNPRGFISPIADGALHYYRYKYEGSFEENGETVNKITVTPRRKNEPLFAGTIHITDDSWRIHSVDLNTNKSYQLEMLDSVKISQIHTPIAQDIWRTQNQIMQFTIKKFGFAIKGSFVNIYDKYNLNPGFSKGHFNNVLMTFDSTFNKKDSAYWEEQRPVALETDEKRDYEFKDSIALLRTATVYTKEQLDSLRKNQPPITLKKVFWSEASRYFYGKSSSLRWQLSPLIKRLQYNTVEGISVNVNQQFNWNRKNKKYDYTLKWKTRYGISNTHLNSYADVIMRPKGESYRNRYWQFSGGKRVSQFNQDNPIDPFSNALYTLIEKRNYMKLYENWFGKIAYSNKLENGLNIQAAITYEDRMPLRNTDSLLIFKKPGRNWLPNHPYELSHIAFDPHQALTAGITLSYQPKQKYIEYPWGKQSIGSSAPIYSLSYEKGIHNLLGSDVDFDKWQASITHSKNFRLKGLFKYKIGAGGFLNAKVVNIPDMTHFNGNRTIYNFKYLNSFQLAQYYQYSNTENLYAFGHVEHHFNGLLTNKIPLFNRLKWTLVAGANTFYVNKNNYYLEGFVGIENIFKVLRVDFINAYQPGANTQFGVRFGMGGLLGGAIQFGSRD